MFSKLFQSHNQSNGVLSNGSDYHNNGVLNNGTEKLSDKVLSNGTEKLSDKVLSNGTEKLSDKVLNQVEKNEKEKLAQQFSVKSSQRASQVKGALPVPYTYALTSSMLILEWIELTSWHVSYWNHFRFPYIAASLWRHLYSFRNLIEHATSHAMSIIEHSNATLMYLTCVYTCKT